MATIGKRTSKNLNNSLTSTPVKPATKQAKVNVVMEPENSNIMEMLTAMAKKLEKLDHIDAHLHAVDQEIEL